MENVIRKTLNPSISICQKTVDTIRKSPSFEILCVYCVREAVSPVSQQDGSRLAFGLEKHVHFGATAGKALERARTRRRRANHERAPYRIIVVSSEVRMVPVEAIFISYGEFVGEVTSWWDRKLRFPINRRENL